MSARHKAQNDIYTSQIQFLVVHIAKKIISSIVKNIIEYNFDENSTLFNQYPFLKNMNKNQTNINSNENGKIIWQNEIEKCSHLFFLL